MCTCISSIYHFMMFEDLLPYCQHVLFLNTKSALTMSEYTSLLFLRVYWPDLKSFKFDHIPEPIVFYANVPGLRQHHQNLTVCYVFYLHMSSHTFEIKEVPFMLECILFPRSRTNRQAATNSLIPCESDMYSTSSVDITISAWSLEFQ